jgi:hypothetical protein
LFYEIVFLYLVKILKKYVLRLSHATSANVVSKAVFAAEPLKSLIDTAEVMLI